MWLWQHKNIHKRHLLWLKFFSVCLFFHLTFLSWVFLIDHDTSQIISVSLNKHMDYSAPILFVPLSSFAKASADTAQQNKSTQTTTVTSPKKVATPSKPTPTAQSVKKTSSSTTTLTTAKPAPVKKATPTTTVPAKPIPQAVATPTKKEEVKKTEPKKIVPEQQVQPLAPSFAKATADKQKTVPQPTAQEPINNTPQRIIPENAHISDDYREVEAMRRTALLQKELINNWKPPIGIPASAACEISFTVDKNGTVKTTTMLKSSGIVMYDLSARHALFAMKMPQWTHGKTLTINFKQ